MATEVVSTTEPSAPSSPSHAEGRAAYTVVEIARLLGVCETTAYRLARKGEIPALRLRGRWVVPKRRFHAWLDAQPSAGDAP